MHSHSLICTRVISGGFGWGRFLQFLEFSLFPDVACSICLFIVKDILNTAVFSILHSYINSPVVPHILQGGLMIGDASYTGTGAIVVLIGQIPTLLHYSLYWG